MNRRDEIAAMCMAAIIANPKRVLNNAPEADAVEYADALIALLDRTAPEPTPDPYALTAESVKVGSHLLIPGDELREVLQLAWPVAVLQVIKRDGQLGGTYPYDLERNNSRYRLVSAETVALFAQAAGD